MITASLKNISILSCSFMLCLSFADGTQADEYRKYDLCAEIPDTQSNPVKCGEKPEKGLHIITGEVMHINSTNLLVKQSNGEEVVFRIDLSTQINGRITIGSHIEAKVNEIGGTRHALSIRPAQ